MTETTIPRLIVAVRSPLLRDGLLGLCAAADRPAARPDHGTGDDVWLVDRHNLHRAGEVGARVLFVDDGDIGGAVGFASPGAFPANATISLDDGIAAIFDAVDEDRAVAWTPTASACALGVDELSEREMEIVDLVARGGTNQQVAETLGISSNTVRTHLRNVMSKLGVANRRELSAFAHDEVGVDG